MLVPFRTILFFIALVTGMITSYSVFAEEDVFDRLDGTGPSGKRVDVIEWEGNLEIHVYPHGSLQGLSAKLDNRTQGKNVMVIGYRFDADKKAHPLVRRAILGVPFTTTLKAFIDPTEKEFDKLAISNNGLSKPWSTYKLDASPAQWYPDGHPSNNETPPDNTPILGDQTAPLGKTAPERKPASQPASANQDSVIKDSDFDTEKDGKIKPFTW